MQAYYVGRRINPSPGGEVEPPPPLIKNPFEQLSACYEPADLNHLTSGQELFRTINNGSNPVAIAMSVDEAKEVFENGPANRHDDSKRFFATLDPNQLVVLTPIGLSPIKSHKEYLPDLARSGANFPNIKDELTLPTMLAKNLNGETVEISPMPDHHDIILSMLKKPDQPPFVPAKKTKIELQAPDIPFPTDYADTKICDNYFFANVENAAQIIAERQGKAGDKEFVAGISISLNQTYSSYPEVALNQLRDVLTGRVTIPVTEADVSSTQAELRAVEMGVSSPDNYPTERHSTNTGVDPAVEAVGEEAEREEWIYRKQGFISEDDDVDWRCWNKLYRGETSANTIDDEIEESYDKILARLPQIEEMERVSAKIRKTTPYPDWQAKIRASDIKAEEASDEVLKLVYDDKYDKEASYNPGDMENRCKMRARIITIENGWEKQTP